MEQKVENIRNVAIIAHVDHGKTTLVDQLLRQSGIFRSNQVVQERVMDSGDIERERGITILSKNTAVNFGDTKINIIDTPGHADFGGEVERVLKMVDGVVLVVDAFEGPMPQTKFVLRKALELDHPVVVCVNKVDRPEARPDEVVDEVLELFMELDANDKQLDSPFVFASARGGYASTDASAREGDMMPLFDAILNHIPCPTGNLDAPLQALISTIDFSEYVGRIGIGKIENGTIHVNDEVVVLNMHDEDTLKKLRITKLYLFEGLQRVEVKEASVGNIVAISGIENIMIGDTICSPEKPEALPFVKISEPTLSMNFSVNDSPFAGQDGKFVTSRQVRERLYKELNTDVSLRIDETDSMDCLRVSGRGELHLSILIETLRREGYEFQVSKPEVLLKEIEGKQCEPMELVTIDVPEEFVGNVIEKLGSRKGEMTNMYPAKGGYTRLEFSIPARGLIGYRNEFLTDTKGNGILNSIFDGYEPYKGEIPTRSQGSLVAFESGDAITYGLYNAQERGSLFIGAGVKVYEGMIVGRNARVDDMDINVCKKKQLTNTRSSGSDDSLRLTPPIQMSLEQCMEFIGEDELLEVTPLNLRMRKKVLDNNLRRKQRARSN
ncbi:GTP-binding protein TypA/BipA [Anaerotignum neopropionicum]|uniref:Large ribosomal subunit assembly factor BipA n=1 Tax=Anaerotignum neopropionicum TaxID=36847 RepID=A0A136WFX7_9FIRM|nr:translational GTPase TypA [Anaerotignum neopropionicum]KXL53303.1 GTP-binding protein TypA/BipA [Anaerotignum neopropionicum]